jgi:hypothetical protein
MLSSILAAQKKANAANKAREQEIRALYENILGRYGEGGGFGKGYEAVLERTKLKDVASGMQSLVSAGLANTTRPAGLSRKWEEEVGAPARLKLEDLRLEKLTGVEQDLAGFIERISNTGPDLNLIAQLLR